MTGLLQLSPGAATLRVEGEPTAEHVPTHADDCAEILENWFLARAQFGRVLLMDFEMRNLAARFRALSKTP